MKNVRLNSDDYGFLWTLVLNQIHLLKDVHSKDSFLMSYLKELQKKLDEHCREALNEEIDDE